MLKNKQPPPIPAAKPVRDRSVGREKERESVTDPNHWSLRVQETLVSALPDESLHVTLLGGADNGYFLYLDEVEHDKITYHSGKLEAGNIVLEIQGQRIAGYTLRDALIWLKQVSQNGAPVMIKSVRPGQLPKDLRHYLGSRFPKGSIDHDQQQTIRDNLYLRTVPCTTREPRPGEVNGVDYTFLSEADFQELEKNGSLLESGIFDGNMYGTPKPPKDPQGQIPRRTSSIGSMLPGAHPSSEGKRRRNRSNTDLTPKSPATSKKILPDPPPRGKSLEESESSESLGPLPPNWEMAFTDEGHPYFIDHNTEQTHWLDPRLANKSPEKVGENELPFGWEKVEDPHFGVYYIDHVNRKTQYEHPGAALKKSATADEINNSSTLPRRGKNSESARRSASESDMNGRSTPPACSCLCCSSAYRPRLKKNKTPLSKRALAKRVFVKNPVDLQGEVFHTRLLKGERGLGFTIIGGDHPNEEFLQIKNVVRNGPAYVDGKLQTGDVLVHVNGELVLGYTHQDVVQLFQTLQPGDFVELEVCRGYPLPFDPDDPNTEIITTIAVGHNDTRGSNSPASYSSRENMDYRHDLSSRSLKSLPELVKSANMNQALDYSQHKGSDSNTPDVLGQTTPEILTMDIVRGDMGFGFTIADSTYGQKVKQILDRPRCKNLQEGDFIQQINNINVGELNHAQVVQVLKDCPIGEETRIVVQRGVSNIQCTGIPLKGHKPSKMNEDIGRGDSGNQPGAYFFNEKGENTSTVNSTGDGYMNMSRVCDELDSTGLPPEIPRRPRTPSKDQQRPKTPSETRPKTPTRLPLQGDPTRTKVTTPNSAHLPRKDLFATDSSRELTNNSSDGDNFNTNSRPPPGPRFDQFRSETGSRSDFRGRTNINMHNSYDRDTYGRTDSARPGQFRSRTPGPELMQRTQISDYRPEPNRPKTPTASDMRSKTPIPGLYGQVPGGNAEFRNNHYQNSWANSSVPYRNLDANSRTWGSSIPENSATPNMQRRDMSDTYGRMNASVPVGAGRPPRQSTSFEMEEPSPSNMMRVPRRHPFNSSFTNHGPGPQSPKPFRYPGNIEDNQKFIEMNVTLHRQESGFGFRIIGGTEEGSQVAVGHIVGGGAADQDGRLRTGDEILFCDGICVINASHHKLVQLMGNAGLRGQVSLGIRRRIVPYTEGYPYDVIVTRRENEGFGFVIISSVTKAGSTIGEFIESQSLYHGRFSVDDLFNKKNVYPWIGRILDNSPAERCGQLRVGDRILAVNGVDISHLHHEDIVNIIKESGYSVTLTVGPPLDDSASNTSQRSSQGSMVNAMAMPTLNDTDGRYRYPPPPPPKDINRSRILNQQDIQDEQIYVVDLNRGHRGFGFSIRGGQEFNNMPLFVLRIAEGGAADVDKRLRVGDQLLEINNYRTENMTHSEAIDIIQNGGPTLRLVVRRTGKPPPSFEPSPSPGARYPTTGPMSNGPIGQSSPYLGRRNINFDREDHTYYNQPPSRTYLNN
ncbi:membrane-associated guanylate kinase, WW and PDZ domain-containing protein 2-like isoform X5 [Mercenaria mercenaria]|uniref:membrane-associated guanylate kinase, WW and PDZ domain-containing protein 2-like isoform X5 n=1 Tax=Mercenaria mercenaria TaxID=6596 RepID=UPI00234F29B7|nr:membrane-associated guanylate kinase, WW and PDZ domain-containing protein 2-like isoform X5 [Mercenaria mercenaria]